MSKVIFALSSIEAVEGSSKLIVAARTAYACDEDLADELIAGGHAEVFDAEVHGNLAVDAGVTLKPIPPRVAIDTLPAGASSIQRAAVEKHNEQVRVEREEADKAAADKAAADKAAADKAAADKAAADKAAAEEL